MTAPHEPTNVPMGWSDHPDTPDRDRDISDGLPAPGLATPGMPAAGVPMSGVPVVAVPPVGDGARSGTDADSGTRADDADLGEHDSGQADNPARVGTTRPIPSSATGGADSGGGEAGDIGGSGAGAAVSQAGEQASQLASRSAEAAQQVAGTAKEQVGRVTDEVGQQFSDMLHRTRSELLDQAQGQQAQLAGGLRGFGAQLARMADGADHGMAKDAARQVADRAHRAAGWLEDRDPNGVLQDVRRYARRSPGMFLVLSLGAGLLAGRFVRGMADRSDAGSDSAGGTGAGARPTPQVTPVSHAQLPAPAAGPDGASTPRSDAEMVEALGAQDFRDRPRGDLGSAPGAGS